MANCGWRPNGRFRRISRFLTAPGTEQVGTQLAGNYFALEQRFKAEQPVGSGYLLTLQDVQTGKGIQIGETQLGPVPPLVLSPRGVAVWIVTRQFTQIEALTIAGPESLDYGPDPSTVMANLALYNCAAGCAHNAVIVAWTDNGQQRYAQVSG